MVRAELAGYEQAPDAVLKPLGPPSVTRRGGLLLPGTALRLRWTSAQRTQVKLSQDLIVGLPRRDRALQSSIGVSDLAVDQLSIQAMELCRQAAAAVRFAGRLPGATSQDIE